jgi:signal recognition particle subunit SRP54
MAGLQGAGKTTTVGKLARLLREQQKKKVLVVSCDVYRPAAIEQLKTVAGQVGVRLLPVDHEQKSRSTSRARRSTGRRSTTTTCCSSTPRAGSRSTRR